MPKTITNDMLKYAIEIMENIEDKITGAVYCNYCPDRGQKCMNMCANTACVEIAICYMISEDKQKLIDILKGGNK